jgi:hypothetical protein
MPPTPITQSWVSLWQYRYTASAMGQQEENSPWCCCYHFVADDTVESLIHLRDFIIKRSYGIEDGKSAAATVPIILASKQLKNIFKTRRLFKTNLVENFDYPSVNVIARLMELILN